MGRTSKKNEPVVIDEQSVVDQQGKQEAQQSEETIQPEEIGQAQEPDEEEAHEKKETEDTVADEEHEEEPEEEVEAPLYVTELMRLYPQYSEFWVTPRGFLHPKGMPEHLLKDAVLYKNKFFNK